MRSPGMTKGPTSNPTTAPQTGFHTVRRPPARGLATPPPASRLASRAAPAPHPSPFHRGVDAERAGSVPTFLPRAASLAAGLRPPRRQGPPTRLEVVLCPSEASRTPRLDEPTCRPPRRRRRRKPDRDAQDRGGSSEGVRDLGGPGRRPAALHRRGLRRYPPSSRPAGAARRASRGPCARPPSGPPREPVPPRGGPPDAWPGQRHGETIA